MGSQESGLSRKHLSINEIFDEGKGSEEMGKNLLEKIINDHFVSGQIRCGETIAISVDQTLFHDATGTMAALQFETLSLPRIQTNLSLAYVDHNTLQIGFENADDHLFLQTFAAKHGLIFSRAGNGICHQVHLERFSIPGKVLLGADSHTPMSGGMGMLAIGVGGLDVALAMAGEPFYLKVPKVIQVRLLGSLRPCERKGYHPRDAPTLYGQRRSREDIRIWWAGNEDLGGSGEGDHRQHGGRTWSDHINFSERRNDADFFESPAKGERLDWIGCRSRCKI